MRQWMHGHSLFLLLGGATILLCLWLYRFRKELGLPLLMVPVFAVLHTLLGVASVKLFAVIETLDPGRAGAMSLFGAVFFMPLLYGLGARLFKRRLQTVFDVFTPAMLMAVFSARVNCILSGCCRGRVIPGTAGLRYPTREAELLFYTVLAFFLIRSVWRGESRGRSYPLYMAAYGGFRFVIEWFREADSPLGAIHMGHIWSLISLGLGISILAELDKRLKKRGYNHA